MQFNEAITNQLLTEVDYLLFQAKARDILQATQGVESLSKWQLFCKNLDLLTNEDKPTRLMLMRVALFCFANPISSVELAQFITLSMHVKSSCGLSMYGLLFQAKIPSQDSKIQDYLTILELLVDLHETVGILKTVKSCLPNLLALKETLLLLQAEALAIKYPKRDIDVILKRFCQADDLVLFPLQQEVVISFKQDYLAIVAGIQKLTAVPQEELKLIFIKYGNIWRTEQDCIAKQKLIAVMAETVRRCYKILPYDTQILSLLALLAVPSNQLKGRIAQIKTGEGKSTIIAMLAAFMGTQGYFVDLITSSGYLAMRDCEKYSNFFTVLGLTSSHISYQTPKQEYFHAQILYGTNADFEFALLRDGLNKNKLRYSFPLGSTELQLRSFDVVLIDEVDNMLLDVTGSARMSIPGNEDLVFIYPAVLQFVASNLQDAAITSEVIGSLRDHLINTLDQQKHTEIYTLTEAKLTRWLNSAKIALYHKKENRDYLVKEDIVIVDYVNTGRTVDGSQWQHSIHQFLQAKHNLKITPAALTGASVSHPTYFSAYQKIFGLTGTMGEPIERQEVEEIYQIDSFDVPPHFHSKRESLEPSIFPTPADFIGCIS